MTTTQKKSFKVNEEQFSAFILYAPKQKLKKPTIYPTPFSLNDSDKEEENDTLENSTNSTNSANSFEEKHSIDYIIYPN